MLPFQLYDVLRNLSKYQLNVDEMDLSKNGLEFSIPPRVLKKTDVFSQFDMIAKFMTQELDDNQTSTQLKNKLSQMANSYVYKYKPSFNSLKKYKILQKLKCNKDIVITHPDKGNGVVILNRDEYIKSMTELISDQKKFRKLKEDPTLKRGRALQRTLCEINKKNIFSDIEYSNIYPEGTKPARLYGRPKIHKAFLPSSLPLFGSIVSSISTYNYNLGQYLGSLISPHIPSEYSTKDSFTFIDQIGTCDR